MKKKGFTLVELLAVIAILAILVIIALPNVMSLFNEAKKNSFENELKEIFKTAQNQWMTDSMTKTEIIMYGRGATSNTLNDCVSKPLQLSGRTQLQYAITVNKAGDVIKYFATDGTYFYQYNSTTALKIENIGSNKNAPDATDTTNKVVRLTDVSKKGANITCPSNKVYTLTFE